MAASSEGGAAFCKRRSNKQGRGKRSGRRGNHVDDERHRVSRSGAERGRRHHALPQSDRNRHAHARHGRPRFWSSGQASTSTAACVRPGEGLFGGSFLTARNIWVLLVQTSSIAVMATGMVLIIVMRQIDLSVGSMLSLIAVSTGYLQVYKLGPALGVGHPSDLDHRRAVRARSRRAGRLHQRRTHRLSADPLLHRHARRPHRVWRPGLLGGPRRDRGADGPDFRAVRRQRAAGLDRTRPGAGFWPRSPASAFVAAIISGRTQRRRFKFPLRPIWAETFLGGRRQRGRAADHLGGQFLSVGAQGRREIRHGQQHPHSGGRAGRRRRRHLQGGRQDRALRRRAELRDGLRHPRADRPGGWRSCHLPRHPDALRPLHLRDRRQSGSRGTRRHQHQAADRDGLHADGLPRRGLGDHLVGAPQRGDQQPRPVQRALRDLLPR